MRMTQNAISRRTILKTAPLVSLAGVSLSGCGVVNTLNRPTEAPTAVPPAIIEIIAERSLNPDVDGMPKPVLLRIYELRTPVTFERSSFFDLLDKDESQLGGDFVRREEILIAPGERRIIERKGNPDVRAFGFFASYRDLERSTWRASVDAPNSVEMRRRWWGLGETERLKPVHYLVTVSREAIRVQHQITSR
ncbi:MULTISPECIES: type VI secretion system lipoprotein TssJ [unclassified Acidovorax]|jgi:type VI secretion system protein VasD|uniref:type VI secretion system lipoprotein TssJ n=2 Tax=Acidovorax TaxID=12916 RepID=UPI000AEC3554|nr:MULTISPECIES: type VI secretion system lipoprotein TssJ [unclassified Acidovorax]